MFWWIFIDSPGYDTSGRLTRQGIIPWEGCLAGILYPGENEKFEQFGEFFFIKTKNILTHLLLAKVGWNYKKLYLV